MIYRYMFQGFYKSEEIKVINYDLVETLSAAIFEDKIFLYYETKQDNIKPEDVVSADLIAFPNGEKWFRMMEIFHYSRPLSDEHWKRKITDKKPLLRVNRLKEDMVSSYIFYHYQYQEEKPCDGDKYGSIYISGNTILMYTENPTELDSENYKGRLNTSNTPKDWQGLMNEHFKPWQDYEGNWKDIKLIL